MSKLWLIGGTQESRQLVEQWHQQFSEATPQPGCIVTVTTAAARSLYPGSPHLQVQVGHLTSAQVDDFMVENGIGAVLDMSHPFATEISQLAIALVQHHQLPYLRYERPRVSVPQAGWRDRRGRPGFVCVSQLQDVLTQEFLGTDRTLLTLGYRQLPVFAPWQSRAALFARILPSPVALHTALQAGFKPANLIGLRPPISVDLEKALWRQWQITQIVTKASGQPGGQDYKQILAAAMGMRLIQIERPAIAYPKQTDDLDTALQFALRYGSG